MTRPWRFRILSTLLAQPPLTRRQLGIRCGAVTLRQHTQVQQQLYWLTKHGVVTKHDRDHYTYSGPPPLEETV